METEFDLRPTTTYDFAVIEAMLNQRAAQVDQAPPEGSPDALLTPEGRRPRTNLEEQAAFADELDDHGRAEAARGSLAMARSLHEKAVELRRKLFGEGDPKLVHSLTWIGAVALMQGQVDEASWFFAQAHAVAVKLHGREHLRVAVTLHNLGLIARRCGDLEAASDRYEQALAVKLQGLGWQHPSVATTLTNLGNLAFHRDDPVAAMGYYARAREIFERTEGGVSAGLASALIGMARVQVQQGATEAAICSLERAVRIREAIDVLPVQLAGARVLLARVLWPNWPIEARELMRQALRDYESGPHANAVHVEALRRGLHAFESQISNIHAA